MAQLNVGGNYLAGMTGGLQGGQMIRQIQDQNALRAIGPGLMAGDPAAMNALAGIDPMAAMNLQRQRQADARAEQQFQMGMRVDQARLEQIKADAAMKAKEYARQADERTKAETAARIEQGLVRATQLYRQGDLQGLNMMLAEVGEEPIQSLEQFPLVAAAYEGVWEVLSRTEPEGPLSNEGKVMADFQAGRITQEQFDAAIADTNGFSLTLPDGTNFTQGMPAVPGKTKIGFETMQDPATGRLVQRPTAGGPEDTTKQDIARQGAQETIGDVVLNAALRAREANAGRLLTGGAGALAAYNPSNENAELYRQIEVLRSNATIESLNAMRQQSPTGGALGNVTEGEGKMLAARAGALDPASPNFDRDLADYTRALLRTIHGPDEGDRLFDMSWQGNRLPTRTERRSNPNQRGESIGEAGGIPVISDDAAYDELLPGQVFRDPDGNLRRKPQ